eukprot:CAMPEP_0185723908 /NCGR_PEP_ID=MMETSP1171-20130828/584_1 /TAXON_ID=374046 /ORGANISM="Helicotheca tamensis, Strain CCMP826" /LENGTH=243 /DNA_ID=CAMNT_0028391677 /DNA_START=52 /DNA_END=780 /DNA_ORIENTATION=+
MFSSTWEDSIQNILEGSSPVLNILLIGFIFPLLSHFILKLTSKNFSSLDLIKQRNIVTYISELVVTSAALALQIYVGKDILFGPTGNDDETAQSNMENSQQLLFLSLQWISILYMWEFSYKLKFGKPLLWHHILTLLGIQLIIATLHEYPPSSSSPSSRFYLKCALILGFHATFDQSSYAALLLNHFKKSSTWDNVFIAASIDRIIFKAALFLGGAYLYSTALLAGDLVSGDDGEKTNWDKFW